jgi:hypothetical protein
VAAHAGAFVWADGTKREFASTAPQQFSVRATGDATTPVVRFVTAVDADGAPTAGVRLLGGGGAWDTLSARAAKTDLAPVDGGEVLARLAALPLATWSYRGQEGVRHIGPVAEDFAAVFEVGLADGYISTVDADGVALAALQGLHALVEAQQARIAALEARLAALEAGRAPSGD